MSTSREISRKAEIKLSIQHQYLRSAEKGEISHIRAWRVMRGMDQAVLAESTNLTPTEISRAERIGGAGKLAPDTLGRIAEVLDVPSERLRR